MKKVIIDGHNLIPKIPNLHLKDLEDETNLIGLIQEYCRLSRKQADLFFDGAPETQAKSRKTGLVNVHFIRASSTADDAIIQMVRALGKDKSQWMVVSSDHHVRNECLAAGCEVMSSEAFAHEISKTLGSDNAIQQKREKPLSANEVEEWLNLFDQGKNS